MEPVSGTKSGSTHSMSGMAAVGAFGVGPVEPSMSVTGAPVDTSSRRPSQKQRQRSSNIIRAPIASSEELSPTSPQGLTPSASEALDVRQLPVNTDDPKLGVEFISPRRDEAAPAAKTAHVVSTVAKSKDEIPSEDAAVSAVGQKKLPSHKPASKLGKTPSSFATFVSDDSPQSYTVDDSLPPMLPTVPGAVRRPHSFVHAMSDQLVVTEPRHGRAARSPSLETQPEEELSSIFEFSV